MSESLTGKKVQRQGFQNGIGVSFFPTQNQGAFLTEKSVIY